VRAAWRRNRLLGRAERRAGEGEIDVASLPVLDDPALTADLEQARADVDVYGIALVENALARRARRALVHSR